MKSYYNLTLAVFVVLTLNACSLFGGEKEPEREVPKPYVEREVLMHQGGAFNSCPPAHAREGRCG